VSIRLFVILSLIIVLSSGCTTTKRQPTLNQVQIRLGELERQLTLKDEQIKDLKYEMKDLSYEIERMKEGVRERETTVRTKKEAPQSVRLSKREKNIIRVPIGVQDVQMALKNAGYYVANVDGKIGAQTKAAIGKFQKDHGLQVDGVVGQKTWQELKVYLE